MATTAAASGRSIKITNRQEIAKISQPPRNGPIVVVMPPNPDHVPTALDRSSAAKEVCRIARLPGVNSAAPTPCSAQRRCASPRAAPPRRREARANQIVPTVKIRRRPYDHPGCPEGSSNPVKVTV